jgi:hypothetical protein
MAIRIECPHEEWKEVWIDYRDKRWPFGDRHKMTNVTSDVDGLEIVLGYIEAWNMIDVDGESVELDKEKGMELFFNLDDSHIITWIISSWYEARVRRGEVSKNS